MCDRSSAGASVSVSASEQGTGADQANVILGIVFRQFADHVDGGADLHRS